MLKNILCFAMVVVACTGRKQMLTIYEDVNYMGNSITLTHKMPNLTDFSRFLDKARSFRVDGWWESYWGENYSSYRWLLLDNEPDAYITLEQMKSVRHLGPEDTEIEAIALYPKSYFEGEELMIVYPIELSQVPFYPVSAFVTGTSNWTLFERPHYSGKSVCFRSSREVEAIQSIVDRLGISRIQSVKKGCGEDSKPESSKKVKQNDSQEVKPKAEEQNPNSEGHESFIEDNMV